MIIWQETSFISPDRHCPWSNQVLSVKEEQVLSLGYLTPCLKPTENTNSTYRTTSTFFPYATLGEISFLIFPFMDQKKKKKVIMAFPNRSVGFTSGLLQFSNVQADCYSRTWVSHLFKNLRVCELNCTINVPSSLHCTLYCTVRWIKCSFWHFSENT